MKFEIKHRIDSRVLFALETESLKLCVEAAIKSSADLRSADLSYADLRSSDLRSSDLRYAHLRSADLSYADLSYADLRSTDLRSTDLRSTDLRYANLRSADLSSAKNSDRAIAYTRILPEGQIIGWKKGSKGEVIKLSIPADAKRSHAFGRKCRAEFADVLEISNGAEAAINGTHNVKVEYRVGQRVVADKWDDNFVNECSHGIHFFITRIEAEDWQS